MLTNVHAMVMAITSIRTQILVDPPIPMGRWCPAALTHSKIRSGGQWVFPAWLVSIYFAYRCRGGSSSRTCMRDPKQLLPSERRFVYLVVVEKYSYKFM